MYNEPSHSRELGGGPFGQGHSVTLDAPTRSTRNDRVPFLIGFIPWPYEIGTMETPSGFITMSGADAQGPDGILVTSGGLTDVVLKVPRDCPFLLQWIRFSAWNPAVEAHAAGIGARSRLIAPKTLYGTPGVTSQFTAEGGQNLSYNTFLDASVYLGSAGSRDYYGGAEIHPQSRQMVDVPLEVQALQGDQDGPCGLKVEALLGQNTTITLRLRNNYTGSLRVNGFAFGYKLPATVAG